MSVVIADLWETYTYIYILHKNSFKRNVIKEKFNNKSLKRKSLKEIFKLPPGWVYKIC